MSPEKTLLLRMWFNEGDHGDTPQLDHLIGRECDRQGIPHAEIFEADADTDGFKEIEEAHASCLNPIP